MILNNRFEIGEEVYTTYRKPIEYDCPICKGTGKFAHNGYEVKCPHCIGSGKLTDKKTLCEVIPHTIKVRSIKASIHGEETQSIKYLFGTTQNIYVKSRPESMLFKTIEEAEKFAYESNHPIPKTEG